MIFTEILREGGGGGERPAHLSHSVFFLPVSSRCLGATQHLKSKFGSGYILEVKLSLRATGHVEELMDQLEEHLKTLFPSGLQNVWVTGVESVSARNVWVTGVESVIGRNVWVTGVESVIGRNVRVTEIESVSGRNVWVTGVESVNGRNVWVTGVGSVSGRNVRVTEIERVSGRNVRVTGNRKWQL